MFVRASGQVLHSKERPLLVLRVNYATFERAGWWYLPWRFDWEVSANTASRQVLVGRDLQPVKTVWLLIAPSKLAESQDVWLEAKIELEAWGEARKAQRATQDATKRSG